MWHNLVVHPEILHTVSETWNGRRQIRHERTIMLLMIEGPCQGNVQGNIKVAVITPPLIDNFY